MLKPFNKFILVPELVIEKIITQSLIFIREDYEKQVTDYNDEKLSYLYFLSNGVGIQRVSYFEQAKKIFLASKDDPKKIKVFLGFPEKIEGGISICINHSGEKHSSNSLSLDERHDHSESVNYLNPDTNYYGSDSSYYIGDNNGLGGNNLNEDNAWRKTYGRRYETSYQIIVTGENTNEVVITYNILKSMLLSFEGTGHLSFMGFENCKINGNDLQIKQEVMKPLYAKAIDLKFEYEYRVPDIDRQNYVNGAIFIGIIKEE